MGTGPHTATEVVMTFSYEIICRKTGESATGAVVSRIPMDYAIALNEIDDTPSLG